MSYELITLTCGSVDIRDEAGNEKPHELRNAAGECLCKDGSIVDYVPGADYLGTYGFSDWPVHVWAKGEPWLPVHPPRDQSGQALPTLGPVGPVQLARAIAEYEHEPYVPSRIGPPPPVEIPAWAPVDPEPEITTRAGFMAPVPPAVTKLIRQARDAGFEVRAGYALATIRDVRVGTYRQSETWSVQGRGPALFTAVYERDPAGRRDRGALIGCDHVRERTTAGKLIPCKGCATERGGWSWERVSCSLAGTTFPYASRTDLDAWIAARGEPGDLWRRAIVVRERDKAAKAKVRPAARKAVEDGG